MNVLNGYSQCYGLVDEPCYREDSFFFVHNDYILVNTGFLPEFNRISSISLHWLRHIVKTPVTRNINFTCYTQQQREFGCVNSLQSDFRTNIATFDFRPLQALKILVTKDEGSLKRVFL